MPNKKYNILDRLIAEKIHTIDAGYRTFRVDIKRGLKDEGQKCFGLTDFDSCVISLDKSMDPGIAKETFFHELTHIALELSGLGGGEDGSVVRERSNEELTTQVSRGLLLLINLNPKAFEIINEGEK